LLLLPTSPIESYVENKNRHACRFDKTQRPADKGICLTKKGSRG
jgi:hypothetical protein